MTNTYILLRNNKETGPLTFNDLVAAGLKPFDLIWIPEKSAAWRYASEITELKKYAPVTEEQPYDRFYKPFMPGKTKEIKPGEESATSTFRENKLTEAAITGTINKIYIDMPVVKKTKSLQQNIHNTPLPIITGREEITGVNRVIETTPPLAYNIPAGSLTDKISTNESEKQINAYAEQYARKYVIRKKKLRKIELKKQYIIPLAAIGAVVLLAFIINIVMGSNNTEQQLAENKNHLAVSTNNIVNQLNEMGTATNILHENTIEENTAAAISRAAQGPVTSLPPQPGKENTIDKSLQKRASVTTAPLAEPENKITTSEKRNNTAGTQQIKKSVPVLPEDRSTEKNAEKKTSYNMTTQPAEYGQDAIGAAVKMGSSNERNRRTRNDGNMANNNENHLPVSIKSPETEKTSSNTAGMATKTNTISSGAITLTPNNYTKVAFGGIRNLHFTIANNSKTASNNVVIEVNYIKSNKEIVKTYTLKPGAIQPGSSVIVKAPDSNKGNTIEYRLVSY